MTTTTTRKPQRVDPTTGKRKRTFGAMRQLPSGKWQASYIGPDGVRYRADKTFDSETAARDWLTEHEIAIRRGTWARPGATVTAETKLTTFADYAEQFMKQKRAAGRAARTLEFYQAIIDRRLLPAFGERDITTITVNEVNDWFAETDFADEARRKDADGGTAQAHAYGLLSSIFKQAEREDVIVKSPCRIVGAATPKRLVNDDVHFASQPLWMQKQAVETITDVMPESWRIAVTLGMFGALRFGEVCALRRKDVDLDEGVVHVRRGVSRTKGEIHMKDTKTAAGRRKVHLPPSAVEKLRAHIDEFVSSKPDALVVSAVTDATKPLAFSSLNRWWDKARTAAAQPDVTFHHLRHAGISLCARAGATDRENSIRSGHAAGSISHHYQHSDDERLRQIADEMDVVWASAKQPVKKSP